MTTVTAEFTIRETTYYTGTLVIDTDLWDAIMPHPFNVATVDSDDLQTYQDMSNTDVIERDGNIDGQEWTRIGFFHS